MADFSINEMQEMQKQLQDKYKDKWGGLGPEIGKKSIALVIARKDI